jgi:hypothetical protein
MPATEIAAVRRELLVRYLDRWVPAALHRSRRATVAQAYAGADGGTAEAALRVFAEFADLLAGRRLTVAVLAPGAAGLAERLAAAQRDLGTPAELAVHVVDGGQDRLPVLLTAAGAAGAPVLAYLDAATGPAPAAATLTAVAAGRPAELLLVLGPAARDGLDHRSVLGAAGFPLVTDVELVGGATVEPELLVFATSSGKSIDAFKNAMWAVDEYAGVRYRDPRDPDGHLLDISLNPHPGPLRRELLARLAAAGECSVTELRQFTATETVYRPADTTRVLTALLAAGLVVRTPEQGRLSGDVVIAARAAGPASR